MTKRMEFRVELNNSMLNTAPNGATSVIPDYYEKFLIEKDAKNTAYFFILSHGYMDEFREFFQTYKSDDPHLDCVAYLYSLAVNV